MKTVKAAPRTVNTKVKELGEFIRTQRSAAELSLRKLAKLAGVSNPYLSQVERGLRRPSADILQGIAKALRVSSQTLYVKAGILEMSPRLDVHTAIMGDTTLTEQQKQVLLQVYDSFRQETGRSRRSSKRTSRSAKLGGRAEMQADPSPHPAPLRPSAANVNRRTSRARPSKKEVG